MKEEQRITGEPEGNSARYRFDEIAAREERPLRGTEICILGSSVAYGAASGQMAVGEYLAARFGCTLTKEAVSGTTLADDSEDSYVRRLHRIDPDRRFALFVCQLSTNDATQGKPLGEIRGGDGPFDTRTVTGALEHIIGYVRRTWNCPIAVFTGSHYDSPAYGAMVRRLLELQKKYGFAVADLWNGIAFNDIRQDQRKLFMADPIHPTMAGYRDWWGPETERQLLTQGVFVSPAAKASLEKLKAGNREYCDTHSNSSRMTEADRRYHVENGQHPYACILCCSDSRVVPEHIFSVGLGALFSVRTAGNVVGPHELASVEYAVHHLHTPLVIVMGHTHCGAVSAALDGHAEGMMQAVTERIARAAADHGDIRRSEWDNAAQGVKDLLESALLREAAEDGSVSLAAAMYDTETGEVRFRI